MGRQPSPFRRVEVRSFASDRPERFPLPARARSFLALFTPAAARIGSDQNRNKNTAFFLWHNQPGFSPVTIWDGPAGS